MNLFNIPNWLQALNAIFFMWKIFKITLYYIPRNLCSILLKLIINTSGFKPCKRCYFNTMKKFPDFSFETPPLM